MIPDSRTRSSGSLQRRYRALAIVALFALLYVVGRVTGVSDMLNVESIRAIVRDAGAFGIVLFLLAFSAGELLHVPGMVFVAAAILVYGKVLGFVLALAGAIVSVSVTFFIVRAIGGKALADIERPWIRRALLTLEQRPIRTVVVLRTFLWLAPGLNYALALANVRYRDYLIGSAVGLLAPILAVTLLFEWLLTKLG